MMDYKINVGELKREIAGMAYVVADVSEGKETSHTLHQTYDICEGGNEDRVDRLLRLGVAEAGVAIAAIGGVSIKEEYIRLRVVRGVPLSVAVKVREVLREYLTAAVLWGWLTVTLPGSAGVWGERKEELLGELGTAAGTVMTGAAGFCRRVPPL